MTGSFGFAPVVARARRARARRRAPARLPRRAPVRNLARARGCRARAVSRDEERPGAARPTIHGELARDTARAPEGAAQGRRSSTSGSSRGSETSTRTRRSGARGSTHFGPANGLDCRGGRQADARHPRGTPRRNRAAGIDAARLRDAGRGVRLDAGRVPRLRSRRRAMSALPRARSPKTRVGGRGTWFCPRCQLLEVSDAGSDTGPT